MRWLQKGTQPHLLWLLLEPKWTSQDLQFDMIMQKLVSLALKVWQKTKKYKAPSCLVDTSPSKHGVTSFNSIQPPSVAKDTKLTSYYKISNRTKKTLSSNWIPRRKPNTPNLELPRSTKIGPVQLEMKPKSVQERKPQPQVSYKYGTPQNFHSLPLFGAVLVPRNYGNNPFTNGTQSRASSQQHSMHNTLTRDSVSAQYDNKSVIKEKPDEMPKIESKYKSDRKMMSADNSKVSIAYKPQIIKGSVWVDRSKKISDTRQKLLQKS